MAVFLHSNHVDVKTKLSIKDCKIYKNYLHSSVFKTSFVQHVVQKCAQISLLLQVGGADNCEESIVSSKSGTIDNGTLMSQECRMSR